MAANGKTDVGDTGETHKERLWVVSELYFPEMTSTGYYLTKIAEGLAADYDVRVICGQPNYSARGTVAPKHETLRDVKINRVFGMTLDKNVIPFRILNMLTLSFSVLFKAIRAFRKGDRVLVVTNPPLVPYLTNFACLVRRCHHVLLIHDSYPEILYAAGKLKKGSIAGRILEYLNRVLIARAESVVLVGRDMEQRLVKIHGSGLKRFVVPNWAELETVSPAPREENDLLRELGIAERFVFLYAGNMGHPNDIESFLEVAKRLQEEKSPVQFVFLGAGVKKKMLERTKERETLENITVLDSRPRSEQQEFLNACDVGIVSLVSRMKGVSMPSRTYNILAAGKPILAVCDEGSEIGLVVREEKVGWVVAPGDIEGLYTTICEISGASEELADVGIRARNAAVGKYSLEKAIEGYRYALSQVGRKGITTRS